MLTCSSLPKPLLALLVDPGPADLGPGPRPGALPESAITAALGSLPKPLRPHAATRVTALLLLWNDHHDAAHALVQDMSDPDGSLIHAILHRREPDYSNARYWFHRVGTHPSFSTLAAKLSDGFDWGSEASLQAKLLPRGTWDPSAFVDACERASRLPIDSPAGELLRRIQTLETAAVLEHLL